MNAPVSPRTPFEVLAIVTSAGGLEAMSVVLADLPSGTPAAIVVGQHLGADSALPDILSRRTHLPAQWARDGEALRPGCIYIVPPRMQLELLPDRSLSLAPVHGEVPQARPLDVLLNSLADSYGPRALAVVLTGMGRDGAAGARAVRSAGGAVLVQSVAEAAFQEMPRAAVEAGAADLELPLVELGCTVMHLLAGGRFPRPRNEDEARDALFEGAGPAREALRQVDWAGTAIGPVLGWPGSLKSVVASLQDVPFPMCALWGENFVQLYNDAWIGLVGNRHPEAAGLPARVTWQAQWSALAPRLRRVMETGEASLGNEHRADINRRGFAEDTYFTMSCSPLRDDHGRIGGLLLVAAERSAGVLAERRLQTLRRLAAVGADQMSVACERVAAVLQENPHDLPFALLYVLDSAGLRATLCGVSGLRVNAAFTPRSIDLLCPHAPWPLGRVVRRQEPQHIEGLDVQLRGICVHDVDDPPHSVIAWPLPLVRGTAGAVLLLGLSPRLPLDESYRGFLEDVAKQVGATLAEAQGRERERDQLHQLSQLDRTRTEFFSNVSHEFRTPLTLLLAPLEDMLASQAPAPALRQDLALAARHARRLLNLVDTLLDFSRIEAGRLQARFELLDLSVLTTDIAGLFQGAAGRAGLTLQVECPPAPRTVRADADMWEKIVSNLLSNALKFTFEGGITVRLSYLPQHVQLEVSDTGVGIATDQQEQVFQRFHRVRGRARTGEGAGIGLAIVAELARLHHGRVRLRSKTGQGSTFTVWIHANLAARAALPAPPGVPAASPGIAAQLAGEADSWLQTPKGRGGGHPPAGIVESMLGPAGPGLPARAQGQRVLVVDDNADMRGYLARVLGAFWKVSLAANGAEARDRARAERPDLVLADVMMPVMDGFALLRELRADPVLSNTPVVLLTARAHEEAAIQGLLAGADDYVAKPFSSRELVARVGAQLELARVRRRGEREVRELLAVMPVGVYACDVQGRISYWNRRAAELWGGEPPPQACDWGLLGGPRALGGDGGVLRPQDAAMARVLRSGEGVMDEEQVVLRADGTLRHLLMNIRPLREDGRLVGAVCAFLDVTGRKQAEKTLQTVNEELEARVLERTAALQARNDELERFGRLVVGRELRMIELKEQVNALARRLGEPQPYALDVGLPSGGPVDA